MVKTTFKQLEKRFNGLHGIRFLSEHLDLLEDRATTSAGKPVSILRVKAEKNFRPSFGLLGSLQLSLFSTCLDCFMIFAPNRHECVRVVIKCFCPISLFYFVLSWYFEVERLPDKTYRLFNFNDRRDDRWKKLIVSLKHNAQCLNF